MLKQAREVDKKDEIPPPFSRKPVQFRVPEPRPIQSFDEVPGAPIRSFANLSNEGFRDVLVGNPRPLPLKKDLLFASLSIREENKRDQKIRICTPSLYAPFGIQESSFKAKLTPVGILLNLSKNQSKPEANVEVETFERFIDDFDFFVFQHVLKNSRAFLGVDVTDSKKLEDCFVPVLKAGKVDKEEEGKVYPNSIQAKTVKTDFPVFLPDGSLIDWSEVPRGFVQCLIDCTGIWATDGKFGPTLKLVAVRIPPSLDDVL